MLAAAMRTSRGLCRGVMVVVVLSFACYVGVHGAQTSDPTGYVCQRGCQLIGNNKCSCFVPPEIEMGPGNQPTYRCKDGCINQGSKCFCLVPAEKEEDSHSSGECPAPPTKRELIKQCKKILKVHEDPEPDSDVDYFSSGKIRFADACTYEGVTLQCLPEQYIKIHSVFFGRRGKAKCDGYYSGNDCEDTEGRALIYVVSRCEFLNECYVSADADELGNPCNRLRKLLRIKYRCLPANKAGIKLRTDQVCFGSILILKCPSDKIIRVQYVIGGREGAYGNPDDIPSCYRGFLANAVRRARNSNKVVWSKCSNKNGCSIDVSSGGASDFHDFPDGHHFDNHNEWLGQYVKVWYYCVRPRPIYLGQGPLTEKEKKQYKRNGQNFGDGE